MNRVLTPNISNDTWTNLYTVSGFDSKFSYLLENISEVPIRIYFGSSVTNVDKSTVNIISSKEEFYVPSQMEGVFVIADSTYGLGRLAAHKVFASDVRSSSRKFLRLIEPRILTQTLTQIEAASIDGRLYSAIVDLTIVNGGNTWIDFIVPSDKECAIVSTNFTPFYTGFEARTYVGSTGKTNASLITPVKSNQGFGSNSTMSIHVLSGNPTGIGSLYDIPSFIPASGSNPSQRSSASSSRDQGYQIFPKGSNFQVNLINTSGNANRVIFKIVWLEAGETIIDNL